MTGSGEATWADCEAIFVEVLSRGPKSAVKAQNELASILRYRLG